MTFGVDYIIYFYILICFSLLVFNIGYMIHSKGKSYTQQRRSEKWLAEIKKQQELLAQGGRVDPDHRREMVRRLKNINWLMAYHEAVVQAMDTDKRAAGSYIEACYLAFQELAAYYAGRPPMERAYFAYIIAVCNPVSEEGTGQIPQILLTYFDGSTVFCRENVLQALYVLGNAGAVEQALALMDRRSWYHHPRLLSDGLSNFSGDKSVLVWRLWKRCREWSDGFQVAVVQFATAVSDEFKEAFSRVLSDNSLPMETRFALLRYFQRYPYPPIRKFLLDTLHGGGGGLAIVAASVLSGYPGPETDRGLKGALCSRNWHVRRNAAASLVKMGATIDDARLMYQDGERYGAEMLAYMLGSSLTEDVSDQDMDEDCSSEGPGFAKQGAYEGSAKPGAYEKPESQETYEGPAKPEAYEGPAKPEAYEGPAKPEAYEGPAKPKVNERPEKLEAYEGPAKPEAYEGLEKMEETQKGEEWVICTQQ